MVTLQPLLQLKNIFKTFDTGGEEVTALGDITLDINNGEYVSIEGPSGGGKSTLLSILGLLDRASSGSYSIAGVSVNELTASQMAQVRNREIGFIFQDFNLIGDMTVAQNVELPLVYRGVKSSERKELMKYALSKVNMLDRSNYLPHQLSGGQQQRVAVARAIIGKPTLLLADEPTGNLDSVNGDAVMKLLGDLNEEGVTVCIVTHDHRYAQYAKKSVHLFDGKLSPNEKRDCLSTFKDTYNHA